MRIATLLAAIALVAGAPAHAHGHWRGGVGISFGFPVYVGPAYYGPWYGYYPAPVVVAPPSDAGPTSAPVPAVKPLPDPIFYPRQGQSAAQVEADRQDCNRWATTQPAAMADASVFQRATLACMDARGYTSR